MIRVHKGEQVREGDVLAELAAPELNASVNQARAALSAAVASRNRVYAGVREEEVAVLAAEIRKAQSRVAYAAAQRARASQLAQKDFAPQQALDEADMGLATGHADAEEANANYVSAKAGPTKEERAITDAQVQAAAAAVSRGVASRAW